MGDRDALNKVCKTLDLDYIAVDNKLTTQFIGEKLVTLNLSSREITVLPEGIFDELRNLEKLWLRGNYITNLSQTLLSSLPNLKVLSLSNNKISDLPRTIFSKCPLLEKVYLSSNEIKHLDPDLFHNNPKLEHFYIDDNALTEIPHDLFLYSSQVKQVKFSANRISKIPPDLFPSSVTGIAIKDNLIKMIPKDIFSQLRNLESLNLANNLIEAIPEGCLSNVVSLKSLFIYGNCLQTLPNNVFQHQTQLEIISLKNNNLMTLEEDLFDNCSNLTKINLDGNSLGNIPNLRRLQKLEEFFFCGNRLEQIPAETFSQCHKLLKIFLCNNALTNLPADLLFHQTKLMKLDISDNSIMDIPPGFFGQCTNIEVIDIRNNKLGNLDAIVQFQLPLLRELHAGGNRISNVANLINRDLATLLILDLKGNNLEQFPDQVIGALTTLEQLNLSNNDLRTLGNLIFPKLRQMHLDGNKKLLARINRTMFEQLEVLEVDTLILQDTDKLQEGALILQLENKAEVIEFMKNHVNANKIDRIETVKVESKQDWINDMIKMLTRRPNTKKVASSLYTKELVGVDSLDKLSSSIIKNIITLTLFSYTLYSIIGLTIGYDWVGRPTYSVTGVVSLVLLVIVLIFQFQGGFEIQDYAENLLTRLEKLSVVVTVVSPKIGNLMSRISGGISASFGYIVSFVWIVTLLSFDIGRLVEIELHELHYLFVVVGAFGRLLSYVPLKMVKIPPFIISFFSHVTGVYFRVLGILFVFWRVYEGGWMTLIRPNLKEDRSAQGNAKLDWHERLAIAIGIGLAFVYLSLETSTLAAIPIVVFQVGMITGGIYYFTKNSFERKQLILTITTLGLFSIFSSLETTNTVNFHSTTVRFSMLTTFLLLVPLAPLFNAALVRKLVSKVTAMRSEVLERSDNSVERGEGRGLKNQITKIGYLKPSLWEIFGSFPFGTVWREIVRITQSITGKILFCLTAYVFLPGIGFFLMTKVDLRLQQWIIGGIILLWAVRIIMIEKLIFYNDPLDYIIDTDNYYIGLLLRFSIEGKLNIFTLDKLSYRILGMRKSDFLRHSKYIDLRESGITHINKSIFEKAPNTKVLFLHGNNIKKIESNVFERLSKLESLRISENSITTIEPGAFNGLKQLRTLSMKNNKLSALDPGIFDPLVNLKVLRLQKNQISELPPNIFSNLKNLKSVFLYENHLTRLPDDIFMEKDNLKSLSLVNNKLEEVPVEAILQLPSLEKLTLAHNALPAELNRNFKKKKFFEKAVNKLRNEE